MHYDNVLLLKSRLKKNGYNPTYGSQTGSRQYDVQLLQLALNARFDSGLGSDGVFGAKTWSNLVRGR